MLVLTRRAGEALVMETPSGELIKVVMLEQHGNQMRMGVIADNKIKVDREEIYLKKLGRRNG